MADNWSDSVATLEGKGAWLKWSFEVPDADARDALNCFAAGVNARIMLRFATPTADDAQNYLIFQINDAACRNLDTTDEDAFTDYVQSDPSTWDADARFMSYDSRTYGFQVGRFILPDQGAYDGNGTEFHGAYAPPSSTGLANDGPFVVGTNTLRLIHAGGPAGTVGTPVEVDVVELDYGGFAGFADPTPTFNNVVEPTPDDYAGHVDGTGFSLGHGSGTTLLKAPDATAGSFNGVNVEPTYLTPGTVDITVSGDFGAPADGRVFAEDLITSITTAYELDGAGHAAVAVERPRTLIYYGGSDAFAPEAGVWGWPYVLSPPPSPSRWQVGSIGVGIPPSA